MSRLFAIRSLGLRIATLLIALLTLPSPADAGAWSPQRELTPPDNNDADIEPRLALDSHGTPWVVWPRQPVRHSGNGENLYWSRWNQDRWTPPLPLVPPNGASRYMPDISAGPGDSLWVTWHSDRHEIQVSLGIDGRWSAPQRPHPAMSLDNYWGRTRSNGGQVWCCWWSQPATFGFNDTSDVFVSHRVGTNWSQYWKLTSGFPSPRFHWMADMAVDSAGRPHVAWQDANTGRILYTTPNADGSWPQPERLNDPDLVTADGWAAPRLVVEDGGLIHVVWVGRPYLRLGTYGNQDIYYSRGRAGHWSAPLRVNTPDDAEAYYPHLAVRDSSDVWIVWHNAGRSWTEAAAVYVTRVDGTTSHDQTRLDSAEYHWNDAPWIALDNNDGAWVVWGGIQGDFSSDAILYARYEDTTPVSPLSDFRCQSVPEGVRIDWSAAPDVFSAFRIERGVADGPFETLTSVPAGTGTHHAWVDQKPPNALCRYRLEAIDRTGRTMSLGPLPVDRRALPTLQLQGPRITRDGRVLLSVGAPAAGLLRLTLVDVTGRRLAEEPGRPIEAGWNSVTWRPASYSGIVPDGVYWVLAETDAGQARARVVFLRAP